MEALRDGSNINYWNEVRKIKHAHKNVPISLDNVSGEHEIADVFASTYKDLYGSVPCSREDLNIISNNLLKGLDDDYPQHDYI